MKAGWCPKCQKITQHTVLETELVKSELCEECQTILQRKWKIPKITLKGEEEA